MKLIKLSHLSPMRILAITLAAGLLLSACATHLPQPITGYTCCNLHPDAGWISSANMLGGAIVPAGQPVVIDTMKRDRYLYGTMGSDYITLRDDTARSKDDVLRWTRQIVVPTDPRVALARWSPEVQKAVYSGKVLVGMTRAQVLMSLSYPSLNDTKDLGASTWRYWTIQEDEPVDVRFGADGLVSGFAGKPSAVRAVEFRG
jgi:hypothetical protein